MLPHLAASRSKQPEEQRKELSSSLRMLLFVSYLAFLVCTAILEVSRHPLLLLEKLAFVRCPTVLGRPSVIGIGGDPQNQGQQDR